ncbi:hypothetical protein LCGC14_2542700 [marine sediment metagenome]|uniref:RNHCP domain-containing protein n=1 Tax=marine sediment metagenome TaxID=412755 RepID=A0A0F9BD50_9ZZZZ
MKAEISVYCETCNDWMTKKGDVFCCPNCEQVVSVEVKIKPYCQCNETPWTYGKKGKDGTIIILCSYCDMPAKEKGYDHHETCEQREQAESET